VLGSSIQALSRQPLGGLGHLLGGGNLDAEVVEAASLALALDEDQLQRRLIDGEVRVPGAALGRLGPEQLRVEAHRLLEIAHVQRELDPGHHISSTRDISNRGTGTPGTRGSMGRARLHLL
jgi:hypothetical protein